MEKRPPNWPRFRLLRAALPAAAVFALCCHAQEPESATSAAEPADQAQTVSAEEAPPDTLEIWLDKLAFAESGNRARLVHRDRDGQLYYGCLQFHAKTFRTYARRFHLLRQNSRAEMMKRIYDCDFQKHLAALMIRNDPDNWKHWRRTVEKVVGMPPAEVDRTSATESTNQ